MSNQLLANLRDTEYSQSPSHNNLASKSFAKDCIMSDTTSHSSTPSDTTISYESQSHPDIKVTLKFTSKAEGDKAALTFENQLKSLVLEKIHGRNKESALQSQDHKRAKEEPQP